MDGRQSLSELYLGDISYIVIVRSLFFMFMQMGFSKVHPACHNILQTVSNQEIILKRLIRMLPIIQKLYVGA